MSKEKRVPSRINMSWAPNVNCAHVCVIDTYTGVVDEFWIPSRVYAVIVTLLRAVRIQQVT